MPLRALTTPIPEQPIEGTNLGAEIKALRKAKRLTLMVMAGLTNLSASYLSRIERYACDVSIKTLQNLAQALGVTIGWFFHAEKAPDTIEGCYFVRGDARHKLKLGEGKTEELLCPSPDGDLQLLHTRYAPNCAGSDGQRTHEGEEAGLVITGTLGVTLGGTTHTLAAGDSYHFPRTIAHAYHNPGPGKTVVVHVLTSPLL